MKSAVSHCQALVLALLIDKLDYSDYLAGVQGYVTIRVGGKPLVGIPLFLWVLDLGSILFEPGQLVPKVRESVFIFYLFLRWRGGMLTNTTKRCLKHSGLITKNLVGRGNCTQDLCYNDSMIIVPPAQTSCTD